MGNLWIDERFINRDVNASFGDTGVYETSYDAPGELFRALQREYGRCISKVYIDTQDGETKSIGWVFQSRDKYEDSEDTYIREVWVTIHNGPPARTIEYDYAQVGT